ncbi:hypothetical protein M432DRAFT_427761 [Thermoascus aurantiacus ATCC 26904]
MPCPLPFLRPPNQRSLLINNKIMMMMMMMTMMITLAACLQLGRAGLVNRKRKSHDSAETRPTFSRGCPARPFWFTGQPPVLRSTPSCLLRADSRENTERKLSASLSPARTTPQNSESSGVQRSVVLDSVSAVALG